MRWGIRLLVSLWRTICLSRYSEENDYAVSPREYVPCVWRALSARSGDVEAQVAVQRMRRWLSERELRTRLNRRGTKRGPAPDMKTFDSKEAD